MVFFRGTAVLFDLDGVLCDNSVALNDYIEANIPDDTGNPDQWEAWYATLGDYDSHPEYVAMARLMKEAGHKVIVLTSRPKRLSNMSYEWVKMHLPFGIDKLVMWDEIVPWMESKEQAMVELSEDYDIRLAIDDSAHWCELYRRFDIPTIHVQRNLLTTVKR